MLSFLTMHGNLRCSNMGFATLLVVCMLVSSCTAQQQDNTTVTNITNETETAMFPDRIVVTEQAMGARCAVAADLDGDGRLDIVSASSNDNAVSWFHNEGYDENNGLTFSIKRQITWSSLGSRIVTVADIDGDGDVDVIGASYYDSSLRWFENDGHGEFTEHLISSGVNEGQGVTVADIDNDGDADIITASSGDNTIAIFTNLGGGIFCEIKQIVDDQAIGARTVIAADFNGDGWIDLASASKDDDTVAWYPNNGKGEFPTKHIISMGEESAGAYSLVAVDIDKDGDQDIVVASNGNDHVSLWRNEDGKGNFTKTLIFGNADFVLSVTAVDFDRDGDLDVASASFFDGHINWYENVDGQGYEWKNHTIYVGVQGHYVSYGDMDGDGDDDLIAVTHAENTVAVFLAGTECDDSQIRGPECCHSGTMWNGTACDLCPRGTYGVGSGTDAVCVACPTGTCVIPGFSVIPHTCSAMMEECARIEEEVSMCSCPANSVKNPDTDACETCPDGQVRPDVKFLRDISTLGNYSAWELQQGICHVEKVPNKMPIYVLSAMGGLVVLLALGVLWWRHIALTRADAIWMIDFKDLEFDDPVEVLGTGSFGQVLKASYRGTEVAVKRALPPDSNKSDFVESARKSSITGAMSGFASGKFSVRFGTSSTESYSMDEQILAGLHPTKSPKGSTRKTADKNMRKAFVAEMRIVSKLRHPCITTVMGAVSPYGETPLLVMECMHHGSLRDMLGTIPLDPEQTLRIVRDVLRGVRFLHAADPPIIHGDLKCANVLVDADFRAKIADFGLSGPQNSGEAVGTPFWMAPELLRGSPNSTQSDVYAFGVLVWEIMTQKVPYDDVNLPSKEIIRRIRQNKLRPNCDKGMDKELVECLHECWAQLPKCRPNLEDLELKIIPLCGHNFYHDMEKRHGEVTQKQTSVLRDVFPEHIAEALVAGKKVAPEHHGCVTIYFSDIVGFTEISSALTPSEVSDLLDRLYSQFDALSQKHGVFKLETVGDSWVGVTNLTRPQNDHTARIVRFAVDALRIAASTAIHLEKPEMGFVKLRIGFHAGPVVSNVIGSRNPRYCLFGDSMNTASRMESTSKEQKIQCSEVAMKLAQKQDRNLRFVFRGTVSIKGKGTMRTYWCDDASIMTVAQPQEKGNGENKTQSPTDIITKSRFAELGLEGYSEEVDLEANVDGDDLDHDVSETESQLKKWIDKHSSDSSSGSSRGHI